MTTDCTPRYCLADPKLGGAQAVAEAWRNLIAVGARPLALTNNLNFGNPERPQIMGQLAGAVEGMREGSARAGVPSGLRQCLALQRDRRAGHPAPTPVIGGVGLLEDAPSAA